METRLRNIFEIINAIILTNTIIKIRYKVLPDSSKMTALTRPAQFLKVINFKATFSVQADINV